LAAKILGPRQQDVRRFRIENRRIAAKASNFAQVRESSRTFREVKKTLRAHAIGRRGRRRRAKSERTNMKVDIVERFGCGDSPSSNGYLLVRELAHRINNELALIIGRASLDAARSTNDEVKTALASVTRLLQHCADVNRALEMPTYSTAVDVSDYIRVLCESIRRARLDHRGIELVLVAHPLQMQSERCWKLGIIVSELIMNSVRHAFNGCGGRIQIELSNAGPYLQCCVIDDGSSQGSAAPGQGLKIVEALAKELDGEIIHRFGAEGAVSILVFPLDCNARHVEDDHWISDGDRDSERSAVYPS
jgi:two-component sensor histidine kinase